MGRVEPRAHKFLTTPLTVNALFPLPSTSFLLQSSRFDSYYSGDSARAAVGMWQHRQRPRRHGHLTFRGNATPLYSPRSRAREYRRAGV